MQSRGLLTSFRTPFVAMALVWLVVGVLGSALLVRSSIEAARESFETDARIAHRLLSQRAVQHEAMLVTLRLLQPDAVQTVGKRLAAVFPQLIDVRRVEATQTPGNALARADMLDWDSGRFLLAAPPEDGVAQSYALEISLPLMVPWSEWPFGARAEVATADVALEIDGRPWVVHSVPHAPALLRFGFRKHLAAASQPFDLIASRALGWTDLPWAALALLWTAWGAVAAGAHVAWRQRDQRRRAEALLRLGQVSRLNAMGELAAGMAHELNQPLTAILAGTQASSRMLDEVPPELDAARQAMHQVVAQARRAADVVSRLRRAIDRPGARESVAVDPALVIRNVMQLLEPECARDAVVVSLPPPGLFATADAVALEQIVHNLSVNALHALHGVHQPTLVWRVERLPDQRVALVLRDNGPGVAAAVMAHLFEPFVSARPDGLGLGLSLCSTLAAEMNGTLRHETPAEGSGAVFVLELPAAGPSEST